MGQPVLRTVYVRRDEFHESPFLSSRVSSVHPPQCCYGGRVFHPWLRLALLFAPERGVASPADSWATHPLLRGGARLWAEPQSQRHRRQRRVVTVRRTPSSDRP